MADLEQSHDDGGKKRSKKMSTRIDLTAMVDLAFLLVTFFMMTTTFSKPQAMELIMPEKVDDPTKKPEVKESTVITVMPTKNDKIVYYLGLMDGTKVLEPLITDYSPTGLRKILTDKKRTVDAANVGKEDQTLAIIKPDSSSTYKNMVDTIDEMAIVGIKRYAIVDLAPQEKQMIAAAKL